MNLKEAVIHHKFKNFESNSQQELRCRKFSFGCDTSQI